jgi:4-hydroxy-2-oxoheptanedioate aldolase
MRPNKVKQVLQAGGIATAIAGHSSSAATIDFFGPLGFEAFWIEGEHAEVTWDEIGNMTRACDLWGMTPIVRVHDNNKGLITRTLDCGAVGIVVPHVNTKADAEKVVQAAKFHPIGKRGFYGGRRAYGNPNYFHEANDETLLIVLIEEVEGVQNLAEILTVDHIDVFMVVPGDLSQSMGQLAQITHPDVVATIEASLKQVVAAGRTAGTLGLPGLMERYVKAGSRFFLQGYDGWIRAGAKAYLEEMAKLAAVKRKG